MSERRALRQSLLREARRAEGCFSHAERRDAVGQNAAQCEACRQSPGGGGRLDAIAALARQPEKTPNGRVETDHQVLVGDEAAQSRPFVLDAMYLQCGPALDA